MFKKNARVKYSTKARRGTGKITEIRQGARGAWYGVKTDQGDVVFVRAAGLKAA
jgi:hypothetical protein